MVVTFGGKALGLFRILPDTGSDMDGRLREVIVDLPRWTNPPQK